MPASPGMREFGGIGDRLAKLEAAVAKINRARKLQSASIGSGGLTIKDGGQLVAGPTTVDADGVRVGTDVELDADGLQVIGGFVTPVWVGRANDSAANVLTGTYTAHTSVELTPPSWVETMYVVSSHFLNVVAAAGMDVWAGAHLLIDEVILTGSPLDAEADANTTINRNSASISISHVETSFPVTIEGLGRVIAGTASADSMRLDVIAFGLRDG